MWLYCICMYTAYMYMYVTILYLHVHVCDYTVSTHQEWVHLFLLVAVGGAENIAPPSSLLSPCRFIRHTNHTHTPTTGEREEGNGERCRARTRTPLIRILSSPLLPCHWTQKTHFILWVTVILENTRGQRSKRKEAEQWWERKWSEHTYMYVHVHMYIHVYIYLIGNFGSAELEGGNGNTGQVINKWINFIYPLVGRPLQGSSYTRKLQLLHITLIKSLIKTPVYTCTCIYILYT